MLEFRILGPLEVLDQGVLRTPTPPKVRCTLALLLLRANQVVPLDALIEELWGENPPNSAVTTAQTYIYQLRKAFGEQSGQDCEWLATRTPGYLMRVSPAQLDTSRFETLFDRGRQALHAGAPEEASRILREAMGLWSGPALANVSLGRLLEAHVVHLTELRSRALELRIQADAELGRHRELIGELRGLVAADPLNEWLYAQLIVALSRCGRRSEALQCYQELRLVLNEQLGLDPQPELQRLQRAVLTDAVVDVPVFGTRPEPALARAS
jgi:SARP family transcriptional regulator, regulator of embCAB operon